LTDADKFLKENEDDINLIFSEINLFQLPNGYIGEVQEAINELSAHGIQVNTENVLVYLKSKTTIMSYLKTNGSDLINIYEKNNTREVAGGAILSEWVVALSIILAILSHSSNLASKIMSILKSKNEEKIVVTNHAEKIVQIKEVKELIVLVDNSED